MHFTEFKINLQFPPVINITFANLYILMSKQLFGNTVYIPAAYILANPRYVETTEKIQHNDLCRTIKTRCYDTYISPLIVLRDGCGFKNIKINLKQHVKLVPKSNYIIKSVVIFKMLEHAIFWVSCHRRIMFCTQYRAHLGRSYGWHIQTY
jgi:hypothetical protein